MKKFLFSLLGIFTFFAFHTNVLALEAPVLHGTYVGDDKVALSWNNVEDATYQVFYGPKGNHMAHGVVLGNGTNYTVAGLFKDTTYVFSVKAVKGDDVSNYSNNVTFYVSGSGRSEITQEQMHHKPYTPATKYDISKDTMRTEEPLNDPHISSGKPGIGHLNLRTTKGLTPGTITLHWNKSVQFGEDYYNLIYTDNPDVQKWGVLRIPRENITYEVKGLTSGKRYWFKMQTKHTNFTGWVSDIAR